MWPFFLARKLMKACTIQKKCSFRLTNIIWLEVIWMMGRDKKPSGPFRICWYFIGFWDLQIDLGWVHCCCKVFVHIAFFLCNEWILLRLYFQLAKQYSAIAKMSLFVNWGHVFNLVSFRFFYPFPCLFICRNGKKKINLYYRFEKCGRFL